MGTGLRLKEGSGKRGRWAVKSVFSGSRPRCSRESLALWNTPTSACRCTLFSAHQMCDSACQYDWSRAWLVLPPPKTTHPPIPPKHSPTQTHTQLSLFPICHPLLSRQQCRFSNGPAIDCYCKVGWAPCYWISNDWTVELVRTQWQLLGYSAPFVIAGYNNSLSQYPVQEHDGVMVRFAAKFDPNLKKRKYFFCSKHKVLFKATCKNHEP